MDNIAWSKKYLNEAKELLESKIVRQVLVVGIVVGVGVGGFYINSYFNDRKQLRAVAALDEAMQTYYTALSTEFDWSKKDQKGAWDEVELAFQVAHEQNSSSSLAPSFLIYQAQALVAQGKLDEAAKLAAKAVGELSECSPFYSLYQLMHASILIDAGDESGVAKLKELANNSKNSYPEMTQYYLAQYYLSQDQVAEANKIFKQLASKGGKGPWVALAKDYV